MAGLQAVPLDAREDHPPPVQLALQQSKTGWLTTTQFPDLLHNSAKVKVLTIREELPWLDTGF